MSTKSISILVLLLCTWHSYGQGKNQVKVDSLLQLYSDSKKIEERIEILDDIIDLLIYNDSDKAKTYIMQMKRISADAKYAPGILRGDFNLGYHYFNLQEMDSAEHYFNLTLKRSKNMNDDSFIGSTLKNLSILKAHNGKYPEAIRLMDSVAIISLNNKDYLRYGSALSDNGVHYYEMGNYPKAMELYKRALDTYDTLKITTYHQADLFRNLGKLHNVQQNYDKAIDYFDRAIAVYQELEDNFFHANTLVDVGNVYSSLKQFDISIKKYEASLQLAKENNFPSAEVIAYGNIGSEYINLKKFQKALEYLEKAVNLGKKTSATNNLATDMTNLGYAYGFSGRFDQGMGYLNKAVALADSIGVNNELQTALYQRGKVYENNGNLEKAIVDYERSRIINDSLFSKERLKQINELQTLYETERKEAEIGLQAEEIKTLNTQAEVDRLTKGLYAGGMFTFIVVSGLLFFGFRQRIKRNRLAREKEIAIYKQELAHKKKELASQTLHLVQKNTFIQELMKNLEGIKNSPDKFKMEYRRIVMLLKKENASDKDWEVFKTYFSEVHNDFDQKLKTIYADISEKEIRLAAFLRMNLTTKEIAATLNVLPDSILKSKYRLKKKLGLSKETDFSSFLNTL
ncbi:tetratricopeptide repeat protein [Maribacter sp. 2307UL18-2]|uniref:tetratricopeptide repeat protein n=1 Tax=Maribacter sp. 2307UL18-2 TaxID=3386274 RepID=UPI0039BCEC36